MHLTPRRVIPVLGAIIFVIAAAWYVTQQGSAAANSGLNASGTIEAVEVRIAAEVGGKVAEVLVTEGESLQAGDVLFRLDDALLQAQIAQARAGVDAAQAGKTAAEQGVVQSQAARDLASAQLAAAQASLQVANLQAERTLSQALQANLSVRTNAWKEPLPSQFDQPAWYFEHAEQLVSAQAEMAEAARILEIEKANYDKVVNDLENSDFLEVEKHLADTQAAFLVAQAVLDRARSAQENTELVNYAEELLDAAESALDSAQDDYDQILSDDTAKNVLEARARWRVSQERFDAAQDRVRALQTGKDALEVQIAQASAHQAEVAVAQAQAALAQAEAALPQAQARLDQAIASVDQAQASLDALLVQLDKLTVRAPVAGVVMSRSAEPGEIIQPGSVALVLSNLDELTITVYLPEDRYGQVSLGDSAVVSVDSFTGEEFPCQVTYIADRAEFTPRNVQTADGRRTTVFAIRLALDESGGKLKPGMPADVVFER